MSGRRSRDEGSRTERAIVRLLQAQGIVATKISGMYRPGADICVPKLAVEVKCCATGFDATAFVSEWGERAQAFGWTARELFGLHTPPERPPANYSRLSRYDTMGLIWLSHGRPVTSLTEMEAAIQGVVKVYRKLNKPALGPVGDSLDDWGAT